MLPYIDKARNKYSSERVKYFPLGLAHMPQWITREGQRIGHACWSLLEFRHQKLGHSQVNRICLLTGVHGLIKPQAWRLILWFF